MAAEAVQYVNDRPVLQDGLSVDPTILGCSQCDVEYHVHYSTAEQPWVAELSFQATNKINDEHPNHKQTISLTHEGVYPAAKFVTRSNRK